MVKHRKWLDYIMLILSLLVMASAIMILVNFTRNVKIDDTNGLQSDFILGLAYVIIFLTFLSATVLLVPVALYFIKSIHSKLILEWIRDKKPVKALSFPFTKLLLITLYIIEFVVILISTTSFEVMLESILTNDKPIYIIRAAISMIQNVMLSIYSIFIIDYLKNKLKEEDEVRKLIDFYNGKRPDRKIRTLDKGKISATINVTIAGAFLFTAIYVFRLVDASMTLGSGGNRLDALATIFVYTEVMLFFIFGIFYFKTEEKIFNEINAVIEAADNNM